MTNTTSMTLTVRIHTAIKGGMCALAQRGHRRLANIIEAMIRAHCGQCGIKIAYPAPTEAKT